MGVLFLIQDAVFSLHSSSLWALFLCPAFPSHTRVWIYNSSLLVTQSGCASAPSKCSSLRSPGTTVEFVRLSIWMLLVPPRRLGHPPRMSVVNPTRYEELDTGTSPYWSVGSKLKISNSTQIRNKFISTLSLFHDLVITCTSCILFSSRDLTR